MAAVRDDVELALFEQDGAPVGFLPYQRCQTAGHPLAGKLSGLHGAVCAAGVAWNATDLLRTCGLRQLRFSHAPSAQQAFHAARWSESTIPTIDLARGFDDWLSDKRAAGSSTIRQATRKARKLAREVGPVRFTPRAPAGAATEAALRALFAWKSQQYRARGVLDVFRFAWVRSLLTRLASVETPAFAGTVSTLHVGDRLIATELGLRSSSALASWFPAYDPGFARYSPGTVLLLEVVRAAARGGLRRVDLGKGNEQYKRSFATGELQVAEGAFDERVWVLSLLRGWQHSKAWARSSPWGLPLGAPLEWSRHLRQRLSFD